MKNENKDLTEIKSEYIAPFTEFTAVDVNDIIRTSGGTETDPRDDESGIWTITLY